MLLGKVIGSVVSTRKDDRLVGQKLLIVEPLTSNGSGGLVPNPSGCLVSVDLIGAGRGETVLLVTGSSARSAVSAPEAPIDACIVGIVDSMDLG